MRDGSGKQARAWIPAWDTVAGGSLQWLPARVMSGLPRWHTQRGAAAACQNSPATSTARHGGPYLLVRVRVWPERHRAQSCAIALRSPASERYRGMPTWHDIHEIFKRLSRDIHPVFLQRTACCGDCKAGRVKGSWTVSKATSCFERCAQCNVCRFVSFSNMGVAATAAGLPSAMWIALTHSSAATT